MNRVWGATYQCCACEHKWLGYTGPQQRDRSDPGSPACPRCPSLYCTWTNYEEMRLRKFDYPEHSTIPLEIGVS